MLPPTRGPPSILFKRGWVRGRRAGKRLTFVSERVVPETLNRIAAFLRRNPKAGKPPSSSSSASGGRG